MKEFDVYISYAKEDSDWVNELVEEIESHGLKACWDRRDFDDDVSSHENRSRLVERCSCCLLVFSKVYCKRASEWSFFVKYLTTSKEEDTKMEITMESMLSRKSIICVSVSQCNVPSSFSKQKMLKWYDFEYSDLFWKKLVKRVKSAKKKNNIKQALLSNAKISLANVNETDSIGEIDKNNGFEKKSKRSIHEESNNNILNKNESKVNHTKIAHNTKTMYRENRHTNDDKHDFFPQHSSNNNNMTEDLVSCNITNKLISVGDLSQDQDSSHEDEGEENNSTTQYEMFNVVYPHLISDSFCAEDEDLTKEDVDKLTLKMEEVETIMYLNEKQKTLTDDSTTTQEIATIKKPSDFRSQHEQMQLLDILQSLHEATQNKLDKIAASTSERNALHKKRYRRLLRRYQDCIMNVVNGKKDVRLMESLPLVFQYLNDVESTGFKCYCCDNLYHSARALEIHLDVCVKQAWCELMLLRENQNSKSWLEMFRKRK